MKISSFHSDQELRSTYFAYRTKLQILYNILVNPFLSCLRQNTRQNRLHLTIPPQIQFIIKFSFLNNHIII